MYRLMLISSLAVCVAACTPKISALPEETEPLPTIVQACEEKPPRIVEVPVPVPMPCQLKPEPVFDQKPGKGTRRTGAKGGTQRVSVQGDGPGGINSVQQYTYMEGALYQVYVGLTTATTVLLQPGEYFFQAVIGDKGKWTTSEISAGSPTGDRGGVVVNCNEAGARSNLTIAGSKRVYLIELRCTENTYHAQVSWAYPEERGIGMLKGSAPAQPRAETTVPHPITADAPSATQYHIRSNRPVAWQPTMVYDTGVTGRQTYIIFPAALASAEAPVLYVRSVEGTQAVVNYRVLQGYYVKDRVYAAPALQQTLGSLGEPVTYYVLDQVADELELRVGEKRPTIVKISRL